MEIFVVIFQGKLILCNKCTLITFDADVCVFCLYVKVEGTRGGCSVFTRVARIPDFLMNSINMDL